jgi:hypothetical protein
MVHIYGFQKVWKILLVLILFLNSYINKYIFQKLLIKNKYFIDLRNNVFSFCFLTLQHCNPLQGKYRFFTGISLCSNSTLTCFGSVQGLKGQFSLKYREIYAFCTEICILFLHSCLCCYNRDFPAL